MEKWITEFNAAKEKGKLENFLKTVMFDCSKCLAEQSEYILYRTEVINSAKDGKLQ